MKPFLSRILLVISAFIIAGFLVMEVISKEIGILLFVFSLVAYGIYKGLNKEK